KFQAAGERRRVDAKYGLGAAIFVKGAHGDETLFARVAEQGFSEDLDLIAVGFERSALTGVAHSAKCRRRVGAPASDIVKVQNGISSSISRRAMSCSACCAVICRSAGAACSTSAIF